MRESTQPCSRETRVLNVLILRIASNLDELAARVSRNKKKP